MLSSMGADQPEKASDLQRLFIWKLNALMQMNILKQSKGTLCDARPGALNKRTQGNSKKFWNRKPL